MPMVVAKVATIVAPAAAEPVQVPPRLPEQLVMLLVGGALVGLGGAGRPRRPRRR